MKNNEKSSNEHLENVGGATIKMWHDKIHFMRYRMLGYIISILFLIFSLTSIMLKGFHWGLDFTGGTNMEVQFSKEINPEQIRKTLEQNKYEGVLVQATGSSRDLMIKIPTKQDKPNVANNEITDLLSTLDQNVKLKSSEFVGPNMGDERTEAAFWAIMITLCMIVIYISIRFEWRLSTGALLSLVHDVIIVLGTYSFLQIEMDLTFIAAVLSVVGYSLNDNIVVFDRVRENFRKYPDVERIEIMDVSLTQTLARTMITSLTTLFVVGTLLFFGGSTLYSFSLALFIGIFFGAYSSIYIAVSLAYDLGVSQEHVQIKHIEKEGADQRSLF